MKKYKIVFLILLLIIPGIVYGAYDGGFPVIDYFDVDDPNDEEYEYFYKSDTEGNIINNAEFIIRDLNKNVSYDVTYDNNLYKSKAILSKEYDEIMNFVPSNVKEIINGFNNIDAFLPYLKPVEPAEALPQAVYSSMEVECRYKSSGLLEDSNTDTKYPIRKMTAVNEYNTCSVIIPTITFLEEVKTPKGLEKVNAYILAKVRIDYSLDRDSGLVTSTEAKLINLDPFWGTFNIFEYDETLNYNDMKNIYDKILDDYAFKYIYTESCDIVVNSCEGTDCMPSQYVEKQRVAAKLYDKLGENNTRCHTPVVIDKSGTSNISIESYVNNEEEINLIETSTVQIKVSLKNNGKAASYDNVVVSEVPDGVEYVDGSATDNGIYDDENKTVTWNLNYLDAVDEHTFSYSVIVTTGSTSGTYITTSSVTSDSNETPIESNEARVTTGASSSEVIVNPKTGDERLFIIILGLLIGFTVIYYVRTKNMIRL